MHRWLLVALSILLGLGLGLGLTVIELGASPAGTVQSDFLRRSGQDPAVTNAPRIVVDKDEFDFGTMVHDTTLSHTFTVRNEGHEPMHLTDGGVSCGRCTHFTIAKEEVSPGDSTTVEVIWKGINGGPFRQTATLNTNDPRRPSVRLTIEGMVIATHRVVPEEVVFSDLSVTDTRTADLQLFSYHAPGLAVLSHELTDPETAANFQVRTDPMPDDVLHKEPDAKSGLLIHVTVKPGLPLGPIRQKIRLKLNVPDNPVVEVPIEGTVTSDVQVVGRGNWNADNGVLTFGAVSRSEGAKAELYLHARGSHRHDLKPTVRQVTPDWLKVTIGKPTDVAGDELVRVPITIEIPPGSPASIHLGSKQGEPGEILIDTGHPEAKTVRLMVRFAVGE